MSKVVEVVAEAVSLHTSGTRWTAEGTAQAALAALDAAGFVVVPKEPTPEMRSAGTELLCSGGLVCGQDIDDTVVIETAAARCVYEVMLRAAP